MSYSNYSNIVAKGTIESAKQGKMVGAVTELPLASDCNGSTVLFNNTIYFSNGTEWLPQTISGEAETDEELDPTSDNPISNKAVATELAKKMNIADVYTTSGSGATAGISANDPIALQGFVNSSIATNTAHYISNNGEPFTSVAQLNSYSGTKTNNDYAFVTGVDDAGNTYYDRYKWNGSSWAKEYRLNNSSFTAQQWAAISSGITGDKVSKYDGYESTINGKQAALTVGTGIKIENNTISLTDTTVGAGTVGSETSVPVLVIDAQGRITQKSTKTIYPPTTAGANYQLWQADGSGAGVWQSPDTAPTANSKRVVESGGVYTAIDDAKSALNTVIAAKQNIISSAAVQVPTTGGAVTVQGMTANALVWVSPAPASFDVYAKAGCRCTAQGADSLTFEVSKEAEDVMVVNVAWTA